MKNKFYTQEELDKIMALTSEGKTAQEIANILGRTKNAIYFMRSTIKNGQKKAPKPKADKPASVREMTPREMIRRLYNIGYRIENNQLVCYVRQTVKISDIINED